MRPGIIQTRQQSLWGDRGKRKSYPSEVVEAYKCKCTIGVGRRVRVRVPSYQRSTASRGKKGGNGTMFAPIKPSMATASDQSEFRSRTSTFCIVPNGSHAGNLHRKISRIGLEKGVAHREGRTRSLQILIRSMQPALRV